MITKLTEKEIQMVHELVEEMKQEANAALTLEENMQISLAGRVDNIIERKEVAGICKGIREFDDLLAQMEDEKDGAALILETLDHSALSDKSIEEQYCILAEVLRTCLKDLAGKPECELEELKRFEIRINTEVTEKDLTELKQVLAKYLDQFSLLHAGAESSDRLFQAVGAEAAEELLQVCQEDDEKYYTALAIYILHLQGKLAHVPFGMGAREIGISAAAAAASMKARLEGFLGKIPKEKVLEVLKKAASVALTLLVCVTVGLTAFTIEKIVFIFASGLIGFGVVGMLAATVLAVGCGIHAVDGLFDWTESAYDKLEGAGEYMSEKYALVKQWVTETALPAVKAYWESLKEKFSCSAAADQSTAGAEAENDAQAEAAKADAAAGAQAPEAGSEAGAAQTQAQTGTAGAAASGETGAAEADAAAEVQTGEAAEPETAQANMAEDMTGTEETESATLKA